MNSHKPSPQNGSFPSCTHVFKSEVTWRERILKEANRKPVIIFLYLALSKNSFLTFFPLNKEREK